MINSDNDYICERIIISGAIKNFQIWQKDWEELNFMLNSLFSNLKHKKKEGKKKSFFDWKF